MSKIQCPYRKKRNNKTIRDARVAGRFNETVYLKNLAQCLVIHYLIISTV